MERRERMEQTLHTPGTKESAIHASKHLTAVASDGGFFACGRTGQSTTTHVRRRVERRFHMLLSNRSEAGQCCMYPVSTSCSKGHHSSSSSGGGGSIPQWT